MAYPEKSYYDILGVPRNAGNEEIKAAYREQMKFFHPDVFQGSPEIAKEKSQELNEAYSVLIDPERRDAYDVWLRMKDYQQAQARRKAEEQARREEAQRREAEERERQAQEEARRKEQQKAREAEEGKVRENETESQQTTMPKPKRSGLVSAALTVALVVSVFAGFWTNNNRERKIEQLQAELDESYALTVEIAENAVAINELKDFYKRVEEAADYCIDVFDDIFVTPDLFVEDVPEYEQFRQNVRERLNDYVEQVNACYASCKSLEMAGVDENEMLKQIMNLKATVILYMNQLENPANKKMVSTEASKKVFEAISVTYQARDYYWELTNPDV